MIAGQTDRRRRSRGQALLEFAVVFPIAMLIFMAVFDLGRAVYTLNTVGNAARQGMRTAIVDQYAPNIRQRAAGQATALGIDPTATSCSAPDWSANPPAPAKPTGSSGVCIEYRSGDLSTSCSTLGVGCIAVVTVKSTFTAITPMIGQIVPPIPIVSTSKQPIEAICTTSSCPVP